MKIDLEPLARKAGLTDPELGPWMVDYGNAEEAIKQFAKAVAAKCAELCASEALEDPQPTDGDVAYTQAVGDCKRAILEAFGLNAGGNRRA